MILDTTIAQDDELGHNKEEAISKSSLFLVLSQRGKTINVQDGFGQIGNQIQLPLGSITKIRVKKF